MKINFYICPNCGRATTEKELKYARFNYQCPGKLGKKCENSLFDYVLWKLPLGENNGR